MKKIILSLCLLLLFISCNNIPAANANQRAAMRTKTFDTNYETAYRASVTTLENAGYTIDNTDMETGLIKATVVRGNSGGPSFSIDFLGMGKAASGGSNQFIVSVTVSPVTKSQTQVRINARSASNQVDDPEDYQSLFNQLRLEISRREALKN